MPKVELGLALLLTTGACTRMQNVEPGQFIPARKPDRVSVWTRPDSVTVVSNPQIEHDTLSGEVFDEPWAMALKDVVRVEAVSPDPTRTVVFAVGATATVLGVYFLSKSGQGMGAIPCGQGLTPNQQQVACGGTGP
jgi:hypothetical protein